MGSKLKKVPWTQFNTAGKSESLVDLVNSGPPQATKCGSAIEPSHRLTGVVVDFWGSFVGCDGDSCGGSFGTTWTGQNWKRL